MRLEVGANFFFGYKMMSSMYMMRPVRTMLWGFAAVWMTRNLNRGMAAVSSVIKKIYLHEDGMTADIIFQDNSILSIPINEIQRISEGAHQSNDSVSKVNLRERVMAFQEHKRRFAHYSDNYMPLIINE